MSAGLIVVALLGAGLCVIHWRMDRQYRRPAIVLDDSWHRQQVAAIERAKEWREFRSELAAQVLAQRLVSETYRRMSAPVLIGQPRVAYQLPDKRMSAQVAA